METFPNFLLPEKLYFLLRLQVNLFSDFTTFQDPFLFYYLCRMGGQNLFVSVMLCHRDKSLLYEMMMAIKSKLQNWIPFKSGKARIEQLLI